jgi:Protein of unknown function (DUF4058)
MKSPFPGMDPFIETCGRWEDFHPKLIAEIERTLARRIPERYSVRLGIRPYIVLMNAEGKEESTFLPDVGLTGPAPFRVTADKTPAIAETETQDEPVSMRAFIPEPFRETFVEIYLNEPERRLITSIEVLSPSNKRNGSSGRELYLRKRQGILLNSSNLVEIDLLRGGTRMPMIDPWPKSPYTLLVAHRQSAPSCRVWPAHFQKPLPVIPVPLEEPDADVRLDLQPLIDEIYSRSRYAQDLDYTQTVSPRLKADEARWVKKQLKEWQGTR